MEQKIPAMEALLAWFLALPKTVQAGGAALTLLTTGFVFALALSGFTALPDVVEENVKRLDAVEERLESESRVTRRTLCILELQVEAGDERVSPVQVNRECN